jgi:hypothetical protein
MPLLAHLFPFDIILEFDLPASWALPREFEQLLNRQGKGTRMHLHSTPMTPGFLSLKLLVW